MQRVRAVIVVSLAVLSFWLGSIELHAQQPPQAAGSCSTKCEVDKTPPSPADDAFWANDAKLAEKLYRKMADDNPGSAEAQADVIRALLHQNQLSAALEAANRLTEQQPRSAAAQTALGETYLRRGEFDLAKPVLAKAIALNPCYGPAYYAQSRFDNLIGLRATAARLLATAHSLRPMDRDIAEAWMWSLPAAQRYPALNEFVEQSHLDASEKEDLRSNILSSQAQLESSCTVVSPKGGTTLTLHPGPQHGPDPGVITIDAQFDGKQQRLRLGTTGGGITIEREVAESLGLKPVVRISHSIAYRGGRTEFYLVRVPSIRFAGVEFRNCLITVRDVPRPFRDNEAVEGYIGTGFFSDFLVNINSPKEILTLSALPKFADESNGLKRWSTAAQNDQEEVNSVHGSYWPTFDRTIAPEMRDWTTVYQVGGDLLIPTTIGPGHPRLFYIDLDAPHPRISSTVAGEATTLAVALGPNAPNAKEIAKSMGSSHYFMAFGGLILPVDSWSSLNFSEGSNARDVDIAGIISQNALKQLDVTINYRDKLMKFVRPEKSK